MTSSNCTQTMCASIMIRSHPTFMPKCVGFVKICACTLVEAVMYVGVRVPCKRGKGTTFLFLAVRIPPDSVLHDASRKRFSEQFAPWLTGRPYAVDGPFCALQVLRLLHTLTFLLRGYSQNDGHCETVVDFSHISNLGIVAAAKCICSNFPICTCNPLCSEVILLGRVSVKRKGSSSSFPAVRSWKTHVEFVNPVWCNM